MTWRDRQWDQMQVSGNDEKKSYHPIATPVSLNAVPTATVGAAGGTSGANEVVRVSRGRRRSSPEPALPKNVEVSIVHNNDYRPAHDLLVRHQPGANTGDAYNSSQVTVEDISITTFPGTEEVTVVRTDDRQLHQTDLAAEIVDENDTSYTVKVNLTTNSGEPVNLQKANRGVISIGEKTITTNASWSATVAFTSGRDGRLTAVYQPADWYTLDSSQTTYEGSESEVYRTKELGGDGLLVYTIRQLLLPVFVLGAWYIWMKRDSWFQHI
jgi:hypothetical protein